MTADANFWIKIGFIVLAFCEAFFTGLIPTWSKSCRESPKILGIANSFAGGVFIAIAFMHITPEMIEGWNELNADKIAADEKVFPLPEALIFLGYTFILVIDKVLFDTHALFDHDHEHGDTADPAEIKLSSDLRASMAKQQRNIQGGTSEKELRKSIVEMNKDTNSAVKEYLNPNDRFAARMKASMSKKGQEGDPQDQDQQAMFVDGSNINLTGPRNSTNEAKERLISQEVPATSFQEIRKKGSCCPNMTPFILMIALSVHSIFEGIALGITKDYKDTLNIAIAIVIHKGAAASSLGISLVKTFPNDFKLCRWLVFCFACATPLGVALGMILLNLGDIYEIIFSSLAAGSFVYIGCSEVIVEEFSIPGNRYWKLLAFLVGASIITSLFWIEND